MSEPLGSLLLDTHALIWLIANRLRPGISEDIARAGLERPVLVSPISAWEIGLLAQRGEPGLDTPRFEPDPASWLGRVLQRPTFAEAPFTSAIAIAAAFLPGAFHKDPADRLLVATARELDVPIVTRDRQILRYAEDGHVRAIAC